MGKPRSLASTTLCLLNMTSLVEEVKRIGDKDPDLIVSQYGEAFLESLLDYLGPKEVAQCLRTIEASYEEVRELERKMCHGHFIELLNEEHFFSGGMDVSGRVVLFIRPPENLFQYQPDSPRTASLLRYVIWGMQVFLRKRLQSKSNFFTVIVYDCDRGPLDFNLGLIRSCVNLSLRLFPGHQHRIWYFSNKTTKRVWWTLRTALSGLFDSGAIRLVTDKSRIHSILHASTKPGAMPSWFSGGSMRGGKRGVKINSTEGVVDKQSLLTGPYKRCLNRGRTTVTTIDMFNLPDDAWEKPSDDIPPLSPRSKPLLAQRRRSSSPGDRLDVQRELPLVGSLSVPELTPAFASKLSIINEDSDFLEELVEHG